MTGTAVTPSDAPSEHPNLTGDGDILGRLGQNVRNARRANALSRRELSERSGVSQRYLAKLEAGDGNISIALLARVAQGLDTTIHALLEHRVRMETGDEEVALAFQNADPAIRARIRGMLGISDTVDPRQARICLIGLRGAGKSTLGAMVAKEMGVPFVELNNHIEKSAGMPVGDLIALYGQEGFRSVENDVLEEVIADHSSVIVAAAGGIVESGQSFDTLLDRFHTIWIAASPEEHMERVRAQGDLRPMKGFPQAMEQLQSLLHRRQTRYGMAGQKLDTSGQSVDLSFRLLKEQIAGVVRAGDQRD